MAELAKLNPGEKERSGEPGVFFLPEDGVAYIYPLSLDNLKVKARYVGVRMHADKGFLFSDEVAILRGDFAIDGISYREEEKAPFIMRGTGLGPKDGVLAIPANIAAPQRLWLTEARDPEDQKDPLTFVAEVPAEVSVRNHPRVTTVVTEFAKDGRPYKKIAMKNLRLKNFGATDEMFFTVSDPEKIKGTTATFYAESDGYEAHRTEVPIRVIEIPKAPKFKRSHISLAWIAVSQARQWPDFFKAWEHLGFGSVSTFPRYWKGRVTPEQQAFLDEARRRGLGVIYNESPFSVMEKEWAKREPAIFSQVTGKPVHHLCPSYRGSAYQAEIKRVGDCFEMVKPDTVLYDIECWYEGARDAISGKCRRCVKAHAASGKEMEDWLSDLGAEMIRDLNRETSKRADKLGLPRPHVSIYNIQAARPVYHHVLDFRKLYPELIQSSDPSLYVKGMAELVHASVRGNYDVMRSRSILPYLSTGTYGEHEPAKVEPMILESFLNGAMGITYYAYHDFDTPLDFFYHAKALKELAPYDDLLAEGKPVKLKSDNPQMFVSAYRNGNEMLLLVGNYHHTPKTKIKVELPYSQLEKALDVRTQETLEIRRDFTRNMAPGDFALIYLRGKNKGAASGTIPLGRLPR